MQKTHRPRAAGEGRMFRSTGGRGKKKKKKYIYIYISIYRYAYIIVYKVNPGCRRKKDVPFHRGEGGNRWPRKKEGCPVSTRKEGENIYRYAYIIVYQLSQGRRRRKDVPFTGGGKGEASGRGRRKDVPLQVTNSAAEPKSPPSWLGCCCPQSSWRPKPKQNQQKTKTNKKKEFQAAFARDLATDPCGTLVHLTKHLDLF